MSNIHAINFAPRLMSGPIGLGAASGAVSEQALEYADLLLEQLGMAADAGIPDGHGPVSRFTVM